MKRGICLTAIYPEAMYDVRILKRLLLKVAEDGVFDCVEFYFEGNDEDEKQLRELLCGLNLTAVFLAGFPMKKNRVDITASEEMIRRQGVSFVRDMYEHSISLGAEKMLILSGPAWTSPQEAMEEQAVRSLEEISAMTGNDTPEITLEFFNPDGEPWLSLGKPQMMKQIFSSVRQNKIGITFDTSHVAQMKNDVKESFYQLAGWIRHLHLANSVSEDKESPLFGDKHPLFGVEAGDFTEEKIRAKYHDLESAGLLEQVDICSFEVISRGKEDWYFEKVTEQAKAVWGVSLSK